MDSFITLIEKAKHQDLSALETIIHKFNPKILKLLHQTPFQEREDLKQELVVQIIEAVYKYDLQSIPSFWEFIDVAKKN